MNCIIPFQSVVKTFCEKEVCGKEATIAVLPIGNEKREKKRTLSSIPLSAIFIPLYLPNGGF